ncbi:MAG TPA: hypothetical protein VG028_07710 [Terriglobia bacterium]|nr:hypothetical protein [Terriglobia bacterium]
MQFVKTKGEIDPDGHLRLDLSTQLPAGPVDLTVVLESASFQTNGSKYDFADFVGKLLWQGDAVETQRNLRDEW